VISILGRRCGGRIVLFKYPSGVSKAEGTSDLPARAHCGRSARISSHLEGAWREIKVEEPAAIAVEYKIGSRRTLADQTLRKPRAERETVGWYSNIHPVTLKKRGRGVKGEVECEGRMRRADGILES
jgi:hypothetical protein